MFNEDNVAKIIGILSLLIFGSILMNIFNGWMNNNTEYNTKLNSSVEYFISNSGSFKKESTNGSIGMLHKQYSLVNYIDILKQCYKNDGLLNCYKPIGSVSPEGIIDSFFINEKDDGKMFLGCITISKNISDCLKENY